MLQEITVSDVAVDVCKDGCGGIWFDNFELKKFDEPHESASEELLDIERDESVVAGHKKKLKCPKCDAVPVYKCSCGGTGRIEALGVLFYGSLDIFVFVG
jgi:hypothetical protein